MLGAAMAVGAGLTTALGAGQTIYGLSQKAKNKRPEYEIPQEVAQNLNQAQMLALQGLPAEQKQEFVNNLRQSTASGLAQIGTRKGGLAGVADLAQNERRGYQDLLIQDSAARQNNQKMLMGQRQNMADYRDQAFQFNKVNPYYEKVAQNQALIGAGMQNLSQGMQSFGDDNLTEEERKKKIDDRKAKRDARKFVAPGTEYAPNEFQSQGATTNPFGGQQEFNALSGYNSGFNYSGGL